MKKSLQSLMTVNLLKRLESSVHSFRLTLNVLKDKIENALKQIASFEQKQLNDDFILDDYSENEFDDDEYIGKTLKINLKDMDVISWQTSLVLDLDIRE